ncbi:MAG: PfkB family carbohydrate kinase [Coriobacteriaceae bacterium]|nr:PfkB family carbohydrate kinase [Coriobacteriaceae bacterium]MDD7431410.1 PfkB family carbohydrate kinase [Coriobacteriaceae bacterium]MDY4987898.1 PfkB family carbohydrate kinase [Eggerthellaceae bacterium]
MTASSPLFERKGAYIPRIAAVHDLCGYGKCSLGVAIPVLSAGGNDVCPVPTGLFSNHTAFPTWHMHDTTEMLDSYLQAWKDVNIDIDAIYSGFLGAPEQCDSIRQLWNDYPNALRVVDPAMADHGKVYPTYTPELCQAMAGLASGCDVLTPNLTEAAIILGEEWHGQNISEDEARRIIEALLEKGAKNVILKGIDRGDGIIRNYVQGEQNEFAETRNELLPYMLHGTGDLYASCLLAAIMAGKTLLDAAQFASDFVAEAMVLTNEQPDFRNRGVSFEPLLGKIAGLLSA